MNRSSILLRSLFFHLAQDITFGTSAKLYTQNQAVILSNSQQIDERKKKY